VQDLIQRRDVIVVASVSCIYGLGSPEDYQVASLAIKTGQKIKRQEFLRGLSALQYERNDYDFKPGTFRVRGEIVEINLATGEKVIGIELCGNQITRITMNDLQINTNNHSRTFVRGKFVEISEYKIFPAKFWISPENKMRLALGEIKKDLDARLAELKKQDKVIEAKRLAQTESASGGSLHEDLQSRFPPPKHLDFRVTPH